MFKTNEFEKNDSSCEQCDNIPLKATVEAEPKFKSLAEFGYWLDSQLEGLVECFSDFETKQSLRGYFARK